MNHEFAYQCRRCAMEFLWSDLRFECPCGGLFRWKAAPCKFDAAAIDPAENSLLRYRHALPPFLHAALERISLGEGWTKTIPLTPGQRQVLVKMDHVMPTSSFKDRGAVMLVALAKATNCERIVQDSSGNAGHAVAVYAARAGIRCEIFVPQGTSPKKIQLIESCGAKLQVIPGSREDAASAAKRAAQDEGTFYASHVYNPLFYEGTKTYVFELWEQLGRLPDQLVIPVGNGTLLLGAARGMEDLRAGECVTKMARLVAVQAARCAPIAAAFEAGDDSATITSNLETAAEGIAIARPLRASQILQAIRQTGGTVITAEESELALAQHTLARQGLQVELTSAATFAAFAKHRNELIGTVVLPICGAGLKSNG